MDNELTALWQAWLAGAGGFWDAITGFAATMLLPSRLMQLGVAVALLLIAWVLARILRPRVEVWMRGLEGRPKWQLRLLVVLRRRLALVFFVILSWLTVAVFDLVFVFPSRRYVLVLFATIAAAWLAIRLAAQVVRNRVLRQLVTWGLTIYATLYYLGLQTDAAAFLDSIAIDFGNFHLSALSVLQTAVLTGVLFTLARLGTNEFARRIRGNADVSPSMQELLVKLLRVGLYGSAIYLGIRAIGFDLTGFTVLSGAIGVGLGFGLQKVVSNLVSGFIILLDKSVKPGDVISLGDTFGWINTLGARYVSVVTREGKEFLIPNEDLITGQVVNWSYSNELVRLDLRFGTSYGDDPHKVRAIAVEAANASPRVLMEPPPVCHITNFGDSSVDYVLRFWIRDPSSGLTNIRGTVYLALWDAFHENGITIPFPQREVRILDDPRAKAE